jgi:bifunctional DNA-binding transcriptional regulator/antitoxin component of YhaV-PrlF toxin-antitoxin module
MSNKYITTVQQYGDTEDFFVEIPDEICKELNWQEGDIIDWKTDDHGIILSKVKDSSSTQKEYRETYYNSESEGKDIHYWYKEKEEAIKKYAS